ncbi:MAG: Zn-ribbon domain-containing OB-fold protein [Archaeoglobaceae archaeon]|nr:Zn-ribbon domain-containing OB-fold protein [Archaeoglobaceae archaeon]MDW7989533.1 Zn-ribbon domain-containing OB-fold protein [Archaeoglobaceae archaeon]
MVPRFWRKIKYRYEILTSFCENCGNHYYPQREICPKCRREGVLKEEKVCDYGKVLSYTVVNGRTIALVEFDNGAKMLAEVCGKVEIGKKVRKAFRKYGEDGDFGIIYYGTKFIPIEEQN